MVDNNQDGMSSQSSGSRAGNPSASASSGNRSGSAAEMAGNAKEQARSMASQAAEHGKSALNQQKDTVAQQVDSVGGAMRSAADRLDQEGQSQVGHYVSMFADQIETFGRQLRNKDANSLIRDAESLSRRAPMAFFVGALAAGFVAARFLKSSAERSPHEYGRRNSAFRGEDGSFDDMSYSWRNEMGEADHDENIGGNRTRPLSGEHDSLMADSAASGTLGGQWGAGTNVAGPEITGIYRPSQRTSGAVADTRSSAPGVELPGSAQPAVSADGKPQPGRPTDAPLSKSASSTDPKSGGDIHGKR